MEIREEISTLSERQHWQDFFLTLTKEELAELLLERMVSDRSFSRELYYKFSTDASSLSELITQYESTVMDEVNRKVADVDFLRILTENVMRRATAEANLLDKLSLYMTVIKNLDSAINNGAGWENEDEYVLSELMDECRDLMVAIIEENHADLLRMDIGPVYEFHKNEADTYNSFDEDNRVEDALSKVQEQKVIEDFFMT